MTESYKDAAWLYEQLEDRDRTQAEVADECGVTNQNISYYARKFREADEWPPAEDDEDDEDDDSDRDVLSPADCLDLEIGDKVEIEPAAGEPWHSPWFVIDTHEPVEWVAAAGENWTTRRLRIDMGSSGPPRDLFVGPDPAGVRVSSIDNEIQKGLSSAGTHPIATVRDAGECSPSKRVQLLAAVEPAGGSSAVADGGDDSWRRYYRDGGEA